MFPLQYLNKNFIRMQFYFKFQENNEPQNIGSPVKWTTMSSLPVMERNKSMCLKQREKFTTNIVVLSHRQPVGGRSHRRPLFLRELGLQMTDQLQLYMETFTKSHATQRSDLYILQNGTFLTTASDMQASFIFLTNTLHEYFFVIKKCRNVVTPVAEQ